MSDRIGELVAQVVADTAQFRTEMRALAQQVASNTAQINRQLGSIGKASNALNSTFRLLTRGLAAFGVALSLRAVANFAKNTLEMAENLHNLSIRLGISIEALSELQFVAKMTGVDFGGLSQSMQFMQRQLGQASSGNKAAQRAFESLGLSWQALAKMSPDQQLAAVADALNEVESNSLRTSRAIGIFGRSGAQMLQVTREGSAGLNQMGEEAKALGVIMTEQMVKDAKAAKDEIDKLTAAFVALAQQLVIMGAPAVTAFLSNLRREFFPTEAEAGIDKAQEELDGLKTRLSDARVELARYKAALATHPDSIEPRQHERLQELISAVNLLASEAFDAQIALENLQAAAGKGGGGVGGAGKIPSMLPMPWEEAAMREVPGADPSTFGSLKTIGMSAEAHGGKSLEDANKAFEENELLTTQLILDQLDIRRAAEEKYIADKMAREEMVANFQRSVQGDVISNAVSLLQTLGAEHRGAAIAALAIEKYFAIQRTLQQGRTAAAQILALGEVAYWQAQAQLGPLAGPSVGAAILTQSRAAAARVKTMSVASAALIGIEGAVQAAQLSRGGTEATRGTNANPLVTTPGSTVGATSGVVDRRRSVVTVQFQGPIYGWDDYIQNKVIEGIRDAVDGKDVVIIGPNSLQASLIGGD